MKPISDHKAMASALDEIRLDNDSSYYLRDEVVLLRGSDLKPEPVQWIWKD
jgi:hypothetical protein